MATGKAKLGLGSISIQGKGAGLVETKQLPDDHPIYSLIGRVAAEWTQFEHTLDLMICDLAEMPQDIGMCVTGQLNGHAPRLRVIYALAWYRRRRDKKILKQIVKLTERASHQAIKYRNRYVHDPWFLQTHDGKEAGWVSQYKNLSVSVKDDYLLVPGIRAIQEPDLLQHLESVKKLIADADRLRKELSTKL